MAAYSYMALVPVIQPPIIKLLTTRKERLIQLAQAAMRRQEAGLTVQQKAELTRLRDQLTPGHVDAIADAIKRSLS